MFHQRSFLEFCEETDFKRLCRKKFNELYKIDIELYRVQNDMEYRRKVGCLILNLEFYRTYVMPVKNALIMKLLDGRRKYKLNEGFYSTDHVPRYRDSEDELIFLGARKKMKQSSALSKFIRTRCLPVISHVCNKGDIYKEWPRIWSLDEHLADVFMARLDAGNEIGKIKYNEGIGIYDEEREKRLIHEITEACEEMRVPTKRFVMAFKQIFKQNKEVQEAAMKYMNKINPHQEKS